jgi:hypothetical protein
MMPTQLTIPELTAHMAQTAVTLGSAGENLIALALQANGYTVRVGYEMGDLHVVDKDGTIYYVEVKTARRASDKKWRFTLYKKHQQDHRYSDFVVLLCVLKSGFAVPFVIPTSFVRDIHAAAITSFPDTYQGKFSQFRQTLAKLRLPQ